MFEEDKRALIARLEGIELDDLAVPVVIHESAGDHAFVTVPKANVIKMIEKYGAAWGLHEEQGILTPIPMRPADFVG